MHDQVPVNDAHENEAPCKEFSSHEQSWEVAGSLREDQTYTASAALGMPSDRNFLNTNHHQPTHQQIKAKNTYSRV